MLIIGWHDIFHFYFWLSTYRLCYIVSLFIYLFFLSELLDMHICLLPSVHWLFYQKMEKRKKKIVVLRTSSCLLSNAAKMRRYFMASYGFVPLHYYNEARLNNVKHVHMGIGI